MAFFTDWVTPQVSGTITSSQIRTAFIVLQSQVSVFTQCFSATGRTSRFAIKPTMSRPHIR